MALSPTMSSPGGEKQPSNYDVKVVAALQMCLKEDHHAIIPAWMRQANLEDKRAFVKLQQIADSKPLRALATSSSGPLRPPTEFDHKVQSALANAIKPSLHPLIPAWMKGTTLKEKHGILTKLDVFAESPLVRTIGRPVSGMPDVPVAHSPWRSPKQTMGGTMGSTSGMFRSSSSPSLVGHRSAEPHVYVAPSWMHEDYAEVEKISKPGGARLKLKDSVQIQALKNGERNTKGTYKIFSGSFDGITQTASTHNLEALMKQPGF